MAERNLPNLRKLAFRIAEQIAADQFPLEQESRVDDIFQIIYANLPVTLEEVEASYASLDEALDDYLPAARSNKPSRFQLLRQAVSATDDMKFSTVMDVAITKLTQLKDQQ